MRSGCATVFRWREIEFLPDAFLILDCMHLRWKDDDPNWLIPALQKTNSPGKTVGDYIRAVLPEQDGGSPVFAEVAVTGVPAHANAGGIRPGASNALTGAMPVEIAVQPTGHPLNGMGAIFEYVDCSRSNCMPSASLLAGWDIGPWWGHRSKGPVPPSLEAIIVVGVDGHQLELATDYTFRLDSATPPVLWRKDAQPILGPNLEGRLRPAVRASFASMIMWHEERVPFGEMLEARDALSVGLHQAGWSQVVIPALLVEWGSLIRAKFNCDNLHLISRGSERDATAQVAASVNSLGKTIGGMHSIIATLCKEVNGLREEV